MKRTLCKSVSVAAVLLGATAAGQAHAAGTIAGTTVNNSATVGYTVGGVSQPSVTSNIAAFVVDKRVNLSVAESGGAATAVAPGSTRRVTVFTVTNTTNDVQDFRLAVTQDATGATTAHSDTDTFDMTNVGVFVDDGSGVYEAANDTAIFLDELAADATRTVFVVADTPVGRADGETAGVILTAIAATGGTAGGPVGSDLVATVGADTAGVDIVFGDTDGDGGTARDGRYSDNDEYDVASATVTLVKSSRVVSDPFNLNTNPKAVPGAVMEYCIQVSNTGTQPADALSITDTVPTTTTYLAGSIVAGGTVTGGVCNADGVAEDDDSAGMDESDPRGGNFTGGVVSVSLPSVGANTTVTTRFRVTVN
jgi:uncharacterized repeat protein (TIGR01451 family)